MFRNDKKGRFYGIKKDTTFVENPPIEDTTTKVTRSINFSKSNFLNLGKWILIIVLFLYFGSYTINGFIASNITKNSTEETIVHEYKKIIGYETGNKFDFLQTYDDFNQLSNYVLRIKQPFEITYDYDYFINKYGSFEDCYIYNGPYYRSYNSFELPSPGVNSSGVFYIIENYFGNYVSQYNNRVYSVSDSLTFREGNYMYFHLMTSGNFVNNFDIEYAKDILNTFYDIDKEIEKIPIYETSTYTYDIKDINYNWDYKLMQISKFRPLFNSKDLFVNEDFYKYSNLITYEFKNTDKEKENVVNKYKSDERLKILFDNESITIKGREYNFYLIKDKKDYISYINFDYSKIDLLDENVYNAYMYALENYVNNNNIDDYFIYSKMNFDAKDLLVLISFPFQIVINTMYNFGVLVGIIVLW